MAESLMIINKESLESTQLFARHYLVGFVHTVKGRSDTNEDLYFIDWELNDKLKFCTYLSAPVSGVALLDENDPIKQKDYSVRFVEFYHFTHRIYEITLLNKGEIYYTIEEIKETNNPSKQNLFLLNCGEGRPKYEVCWTDGNIEVLMATGLGKWHLMLAKFPKTKTSAAYCVRALYYNPVNPSTKYTEAQSCPEIKGYSDNAKKFWFSLVTINRHSNPPIRSYVLFMVEVIIYFKLCL